MFEYFYSTVCQKLLAVDEETLLLTIKMGVQFFSLHDNIASLFCYTIDQFCFSKLTKRANLLRSLLKIEIVLT